MSIRIGKPAVDIINIAIESNNLVPLSVWQTESKPFPFALKSFSISFISSGGRKFK